MARVRRNQESDVPENEGVWTSASKNALDHLKSLEHYDEEARKQAAKETPVRGSYQSRS